MDSQPELTVVQTCAVSPLPRSTPPAVLPLTFLDVPWLLFSPAQPLFFYEFPTTTSHFTQTILPVLNRALGLTLHHFFPFAGNLMCPSSRPSDPVLEYSDGDTVSLTVAEAAAECFDFDHLISGSRPKLARDFHTLVPNLRNELGPKQPILAVQITVFPGSGLSIGFTLRHVAADWRTFDNFLRRWASLTRSGGEALDLEQIVAVHDRSVIRDPIHLRDIFLKECWEIVNNSWGKSDASCNNGIKNNYNDIMTRATFVMGPKEMDRVKKWIITRSEDLFGSTRLLLSPYVVTCAYVWVCWMKAMWNRPLCSSEDDDDEVHYFGFIAGGIHRVGYSVPSTYVGNCVGFGRCSAWRSELLGVNGVARAAKALGDTITALNKDMFVGATNWISEWEEMRRSPNKHIIIAGSPKLDLYQLDFGWGRPAQIEEVSIDTTGSIALCGGRKVDGSIEIGLALPEHKMDAFTTLFTNGLLEI